ncbi:UNVERIFIED_CONTAM: hypothetical protein HDU68_003113 [Siphonaria sp. JEL0065]|nr:hypothetical protein HDU68_003113 [Siphonaria sp. JEL0065]
MEVTVIDTVLRTDSNSTYVEGSVRISLPLLMHAQSRINREELKPLSLEAVIVGKTKNGEADTFFYSSEPLVLWRSTAISSSSGLNNLNMNGGGSANRRENVWSFCSDVSTGNEDHTLDEDFNENDRIFDTALKQGASFMQFPFRFKVNSDLPPSMSPLPNSYSLDASCPHCVDQLETDSAKPGLVKFPQYEVMAMLSFESFAVSAYQVVSASIPITRSLRSDIVRDEVLKGEGVVGSGAFRFKFWDAPKYYLLGSTIPYDFKLQLIAGTIELSKIDTVTVRPVFRYRHMSAPETPTMQQAHLYTPYQATQPQPSRTIFLPQPAPGAPTPLSQTLAITLPPLTSIPYPTAANLGSWALENSLEIAITYRPPQTGSLGRMMKPTHSHHLHHVDGGYVQLSDGLRMTFMSIPIVVVQPYVDMGLVPSVSEYFEDEEAKRRDMEQLMDRVEQMGAIVGGTVSCLFSAKKLVRIGLKDWVAAGTDEEMSVNRGKRVDQDEEGHGAVAMYRSDAKVKLAPPVQKEAPVSAPVPVPVAQVAPPIPAVISPYIPQRTVSAVTIAAELAASPTTPISPSIPLRKDSSDVAAILDTERRQSIVQSLNLTEIPSPQSSMPIIPKRGNSQQPKRIFVQPQLQKVLLPLTRGFGVGGTLDRRPVPTRNVLPPLPAGQQQLPIPPRQPYGGVRNPSINTASDTTNSQWGSGIPGSSLNRPLPPRPSVPVPTSSLNQPDFNDDQVPVSSLSYELNDDEFFSNGENTNNVINNRKSMAPPRTLAQQYMPVEEISSYEQEEEEEEPTTPQKKQVTFNDEIEAFSAKSIAFTESTTSGMSHNDSDFDDGFQFTPPPPIVPPKNNRMSMMTPSSPTMTFEEAEEFAQRLSLGTRVEEEILLLSGDEENGVDVYDSASQNQSMVPGGRGVLESPPNTWEEGGVVVGIVDEFGRPLRTASLPRRVGPGPLEGGLGVASASLPRGVGAGVPRGPLDDSNTWSKAGGFLTRMVGSLGRPPIPPPSRGSSQERMPGASSSASPSNPLSTSPVIITPRTSSARWTEDERKP